MEVTLCQNNEVVASRHDTAISTIKMIQPVYYLDIIIIIQTLKFMILAAKETCSV